MCKSGPKNILVQSNYDTSPYCQYLQSHFNICENKTAVMEIGCQFTCEKCKVCGRFYFSVHWFLKKWSEHKLLHWSYCKRIRIYIYIHNVLLQIMMNVNAASTPKVATWTDATSVNVTKDSEGTASHAWVNTPYYR